MTNKQEWLDEPNHTWKEIEGYDCIITRDEEYGNLRGYVALKPDHPWYGKRFLDWDISQIDVHGRIICTSNQYPLPYNIPVPYFNNGPRWWLGFHAATDRDYRPF